MLYIVHGDDPVKSRQLILNQQQKLGVETKLELTIESVSPAGLFTKLTSPALFNYKQLYILDITTAGRKNVDEYIKVLTKVPATVDLVILSTKELSDANSFIKHAQALQAKVIKSTKEPDSDVFKVLDALGTKNRMSAYTELHKLEVAGVDEIYIVTMIQYLLRNLAYCIYNSSKLSSVRPFVLSKMRAQAKNFTQQTLKELYAFTYSVEKAIKTGEQDRSIALTLVVEKMLHS